LKLARRLSGGLQFQGSYTFAHSIDDASGAAGAAFTGQSNTLAGSELDKGRIARSDR
jgi:hypothetical protein